MGPHPVHSVADTAAFFLSMCCWDSLYPDWKAFLVTTWNYLSLFCFYLLLFNCLKVKLYRKEVRDLKASVQLLEEENIGLVRKLMDNKIQNLRVPR